MFRLAGILIWPSGFTATRRVRGQRIEVKALVATIDDATIQPDVFACDPRHDPLPDDVEHRRAVIIKAAITRPIQELADLDLHAVAQLQSAISKLGITADGGG